MLKPTKPTDLTIDVQLYDDNNVEIDVNVVSELEFVVYTPQTPEAKKIVLNGDRYSNGKLFIQERELRNLSSGELFLNTRVSVVNEAYEDGTYDDERTASLGLYLDNIYDAEHDNTDIDDLAEKVQRNTDDISDIKADQIVQTNRLDGFETTVGGMESDIQGAQDSASAANRKADQLRTEFDALDFSPYAKKTELPTRTSDLVNDSGYLTEHQSLQGLLRQSDLSDYALRSEIPSVVNFASKSYVADAIAAIPAQDMSAYARKSEIPTRTSQLTNDQGFLTAIPSTYATKSYVDDMVLGQDFAIDLTSYAKKSDLTIFALKEEIPAVANYATKQYADNAANAAVGALDLTSYATKQYVTNALATQTGGGNIDLSGYATKADIAGFITLADLPSMSNYATKTYVQAEIANIDLSDVSVDLTPYAKKSELPTVPTNVSAFTNDAGYLTSHQSLAGYVTSQSLASTLQGYQLAGSYATTAYVDQKVAEAANGGDIEIQQYDDTSVRQLIAANTTKINDLSTGLAGLRTTVSGIDLTPYALRSQIPTVPANISAFTNDAGYISSIPSTYAKKTDIPSALSQLTNDTNFLTAVPNTYATKDYVTESISQYMPDLTAYAKKTELPTKLSEMTNDVGFITSIPSDYVKKSYVDTAIAEGQPNLSAYATKAEIPTRTSTLLNDSGFVTQAAVTQAVGAINLTDYALRSEIPSMSAYATKTFVEEAIADVDHTPYALKSEVPSLTGYATQQYVDNAVQAASNAGIDLTPYALKTDVSSAFAGYYTKAQVDSKIADISLGDVSVDLTNYYTKTETNSLFYNKAEVDSRLASAVSGGQIDLTGYATKQDLNLYATRLSLNDYATKLYVDTAVQDVIAGEIDLTGYVKFGDLSNYVTQQDLTNALSNVPSGDSSVDLSGYYTKAQVDSKLDASYYTKAQVDELADKSQYAKKTELPKAQSSAAGDSNAFAYSTGAPSDQHSIVNRFAFTSDASTASMTFGNWGSLLSQNSISLPVADASHAGVMTAQLVQTINSLLQRIQTLEGSQFNWRAMTIAEYNNLAVKDPNVFYFITNG